MSLSTRDLLKRHTADIVRPRWEQHEAALGNLVTTVHDPDATDEQAEAAALAFLDDWGSHVLYCKTARYGLILWVMSDRPEVGDKVDAFSTYLLKRTDYDGIADWYSRYTSPYQEATS